jgi:thiol-disulfide isomerase/thioredoxin
MGFILFACRTISAPFITSIYPTESSGTKERIPRKATQTGTKMDGNNTGIESKGNTLQETDIFNQTEIPKDEDGLNAIIRGYFTPTNEIIYETTPELISTLTPTSNLPTDDQSTVTPIATSTPVELPPWISSELKASDPSLIKLNSGKYQFIEFFAFWCGTCQALAPEIHDLEEKYRGDIIFTYLDIDDPSNEYFMRELRFRKQPHFILIDEVGEKQIEWIGNISYKELVEIFEEISNSNQ